MKEQAAFGFVLAIVLVSTFLAVYTMAKSTIEECERQKQEIRESYGPDIRACFLPFEERELWDCIRNEKDDDSAGGDRSASPADYEVGHDGGDAPRAPQVRKDL